MQLLQTGRIPYQSCPLCESTRIEKKYVADCTKHPLYKPGIPPDMRWMACMSCGHIFTNGYFTEEALKLIFSSTHENQKVGFDLERQRAISARMIEKVLPYVHEGYWLDIGFGNGALLYTAEEYGFTPVGIDLRTDNVEVIKRTGVEAYCLDINELDHPGRYSVISMADVLEHMPYPGRVLEVVHKLLSNNGALLLSMPNMDSMLWKTLNNNGINPYWGELEHYHNFGRNRLYSLLREKGFDPVRFGISERYRACMEVVAKKQRN